MSTPIDEKSLHLRFAMTLRPQDSVHTINTAWTSSSIFLPDTPGVGVSRILVQGSFRLGRQGNVVVMDDFQLGVSGDWQVRGAREEPDAERWERVDDEEAPRPRRAAGPPRRDRVMPPIDLAVPMT